MNMDPRRNDDVKVEIKIIKIMWIFSSIVFATNPLHSYNIINHYTCKKSYQILRQPENKCMWVMCVVKIQILFGFNLYFAIMRFLATQHVSPVNLNFFVDCVAYDIDLIVYTWGDLVEIWFIDMCTWHWSSWYLWSLYWLKEPKFDKWTIHSLLTNPHT